ncbi:MAG: hypothetical protein RLZZ399_1381 [Verrucomicrobiota bacterium]|jgi:hypothetical protein
MKRSLAALIAFTAPGIALCLPANAAAPMRLTSHLSSPADLSALRNLEADWNHDVLSLSTTKADLLAWAVIPAAKGGWNLARHAAVTAEITNTGDHSVGVMLWVVGNPGWSAVQDTARLDPKEKRIFSCNLRATYPDGTPKLNPHDIPQVQVMLSEPVSANGKTHFSPKITRPVAIEVRNLAAEGDAPEWQRPTHKMDLPAMEDTAPAPGKRVRFRLAGDGDRIYAVLNLPTDWTPNAQFPVIVEYPGNFFFSPECYSSGLPDQCVIGYGITRGKGAICLSMPFVDRAAGKIAEDGWGNADDTADYALRMVEEICTRFGGDRQNVLLTGFSRGAIACGYIGLRNDRIAALWKGFHACQHYDGDGWRGATLSGALERAARFRGQAVFHTDNPQKTFQPLMDVMKVPVKWTQSGLRFHSTAMFLDDRPSTQELREWFWKLVQRPTP